MPRGNFWLSITLAQIVSYNASQIASPHNQESPRQTKPKKGAKWKVHEFRPFLWILAFFLGKTSTIHIELLFRKAPAKSSWTGLSLVWFAGVTPDTREDIFPCFKIAPVVREIARQLSGKNCLAAIFASRHQDASPALWVGVGGVGVFDSETLPWRPNLPLFSGLPSDSWTERQMHLRNLQTTGFDEKNRQKRRLGSSRSSRFWGILRGGWICKPNECVGKVWVGALKWGLKATLCNSRTIVYNCALLWPFWDPFGSLSKENLSCKMTTIVGNRGQLWTSTLSPHLLSPHLDFPEFRRSKINISCQLCSAKFAALCLLAVLFPLSPFWISQASLNFGFQTMVRVLFGNPIPLLPL